MASQQITNEKISLYPSVIQSNPDTSSPFLSNPNPNPNPPSSSLYPSLDMRELVENLFPDMDETHRNPDDPIISPSAPPQSFEEVLIKLPGAILHLIDKKYSVELACGDFTLIRLIQDGKIVAVLARVDDEIQWPLTKDEACVRLDDSHYFFSLHSLQENDPDLSDDEGSGQNSGRSGNESDNLLNYGLTFASKGQEGLLKKLDGILQQYSSFSVQKVSEKGKTSGVLDGTVEKQTSPADLKSESKKEMMEGRCRAYWTTLAPNIEDYSGTAAKLIAAGSGKLIRGILWCGDVTVDRLNWGNEVMKKRMSPGSKAEINPDTLKRIKRVKRMTKMTEKVATGVLSGVLKVSGFVTSSVVNSKAGKKFFGLLPGEMLLASLDGFTKICDALEVAGKNVMSTSSSVTTELVSQRYGEEAGKATNEGLGAAGHAFGTAWTVFKIRKAINPKSAMKATTLAKKAAKAAAAEAKIKKSSM